MLRYNEGTTRGPDHQQTVPGKREDVSVAAVEFACQQCSIPYPVQMMLRSVVLRSVGLQLLCHGGQHHLKLFDGKSSVGSICESSMREPCIILIVISLTGDLEASYGHQLVSACSRPDIGNPFLANNRFSIWQTDLRLTL